MAILGSFSVFVPNSRLISSPFNVPMQTPPEKDPKVVKTFTNSPFVNNSQLDFGKKQFEWK